MCLTYMATLANKLLLKNPLWVQLIVSYGNLAKFELQIVPIDFIHDCTLVQTADPNWFWLLSLRLNSVTGFPL